MSSHTVKILEAYYITHDVKRFVIEKPTGFEFIPGQAADVSINLPGWTDQLRPFTFTCLRDETYLEFMIKIYSSTPLSSNDEHKGVTAKLGGLNAGSELILHDVFGAIQYKGPGIFIAGGAGITPFISILRTLHKEKKLRGNKLIYSNKTSADVIMDSELQMMLKDDFIKIFTRENSVGFFGRRIDRDYLIDHIKDFGQNFYICGPDEFVNDISRSLIDLGAKPDYVVFEK
jgi:ferredoxin-NADP reductase